MTLPSPTPPPAGPAQVPQPAPRTDGRLRQVGWASVPVWSLGMLAFVPFVALALARRRARDWAVAAAYFAAVAVLLVIVPSGGHHGGRTDLVGGGAILLMGLGAVHALVAFRPGAGALAAGPVDALSVPSNQDALAAARQRMHRREEARKLARTNPELARELRIGRPDLQREYDDGGLVDVNHVPAGAMASALGLTPQEAAAVAAARTQIGRFSSPEELSVYAQLPPDRMDTVGDLIWFG
jgi:DNA uptake protein ComE-like DNA-binding protein